MKDRLKEYTCKICKNKFEMLMSTYGRRSMTGLKGVCNEIDCKAKAAMKVIEKKKQTENRGWRKRKKSEKEKAKTISAWKDDLQKVINWIVKIIDENEPCISHPEMVGFLRYDAGHLFTVKSHSDIRFNLHNIHKQNSQANEKYGGCPEYVVGLTNRYGQLYVDMCLGLPLKYKGTGKREYTIPNIRDIYLPAARKLKREMEKGFRPSRDQANEIIGIYK